MLIHKVTTGLHHGEDDSAPTSEEPRPLQKETFPCPLRALPRPGNESGMVNGRLYRAVLTGGHSKPCIILLQIHRSTQLFTQRSGVGPAGRQPAPREQSG